MEAWEHQLNAAEQFNTRVFALLEREFAADPGLKEHLREQLTGQGLLPGKPVDDTELLDFISTKTLGRYYRRYREAGLEFARRDPAWRVTHRGQYERRIREIYVPWARRVDAFPMGELDELLFQEDVVEAQARVLTSACAVLAALRAGEKNPTCAAALARLDLAGELGIEPFTGKEIGWERSGGKLKMRAADRTDLIFVGIPAATIQRHWLNGGRPVAIPAR